MKKTGTADAAAEVVNTPEAPAKKAPAKTKKATAAKTAAKKSPAKKTTAVKAAGSDKKEKAVKADAETAAKAPAKKACAKRTCAKKTTKKAAKDVAGSDQTPAEVAARVEVIEAEAKAGAKIIADLEKKAVSEKDAAMASREVLAAKAAAHMDGQNNLGARSKADAKVASKGFKKPKRKKAAKKKAAKDVEVKVVSIVIDEEVLANAAAASRKALTNKAAAQTVLCAGQSKAEEAEVVDTIKAEDADGVKVMEAEAKLGEEVCAEKAAMASREGLAAKAAAHMAGQNNLSERSKADAKVASKGFKKPKRKKATKKTAKAKAVEAEEAVIAAEAKAGARLEEMIAKVEGTPYEDVVANVKNTAAANSRAALADRAKTVLGTKKVEKKDMTPEERAFYDTLDDQTLMDMMAALGLDMDLDTLLNELTRAESIDGAIAGYKKEAADNDKVYTFTVDGFDDNVIEYLCKRLAERIPNKKEDNLKLAAKITADTDRMLINEGINDSAIYNDLFDDVRQVLVYAQQNQIESLEEMEKIIPADLHALIDRFMTVALTMLPGWQYNDVKYYEGFLYGVMAQFDDLADWQNRALMDIADLYILHGDYTRGNDGYAYVLRENQLKDQIYFRFANVYADFDLQRAKGIARDALRVIDGRYDFYSNLIDILNR